MRQENYLACHWASCPSEHRKALSIGHTSMYRIASTRKFSRAPIFDILLCRRLVPRHGKWVFLCCKVLIHVKRKYPRIRARLLRPNRIMSYVLARSIAQTHAKCTSLLALWCFYVSRPRLLAGVDRISAPISKRLDMYRESAVTHIHTSRSLYALWLVSFRWGWNK